MACAPVALPWPPGAYLDQNARDASYSERCDQSQTEQDNDLCQQWRMAVAAENMLLVAIMQTGIVTVALGFSIWAAIASSRQARASEDQLASMERAHLLVHFDDDGFIVLPDKPVAIAGPTRWRIHNYSNTVAFVRWRHAQHAFLPSPEIPPPLDWEVHVGGGVPHGVVCPAKDDSLTFSTRISDSVGSDQIDAHKENGRWFFQGFVAYQDNTPGMHILLFTYMLEEGELRILSTGSFEDDAKYNDNRRSYRPKRSRLMRREVARRLRKVASWLEAKPKK